MEHVAHHLRSRAVVLDQQVLFLHLLRFLELHFGGQVLHAAVEHLFDVAGVPLENFLDFTDVLQVFLLCLPPDARACAVLQVILQADVELAGPYVLGREVEVAGADGIQVLDEVEHGIHGRQVAVGSVVRRAVADDAAGLEDAREVFVLDADAGVGLVVLQQDVVARLVFLDEVVLQQQGVFFGVDHDVADVGYLAHQYAGLAGPVVAVEVGGDSPFQIFGLSNVDDGSFAVQVLVDAGAFGQVQHDAFQVVVELQFGCLCPCAYRLVGSGGTDQGTDGTSASRRGAGVRPVRARA